MSVYQINDLEKGLLVRAGDEKDDIRLDIKVYRNTNIIAPQAEKIWQVLLHRNSCC